jgi:Spy/CpxP family protein refolding chaperone
MQKPKVLALALLTAVFAAGAVTGGALRAWADGRGEPAPGSKGERTVARLTGELDLTAAQQDSVRAVFQRYKPAMDAVWREVHPRFDAVRQRVRADVMTHLTPEQRERYRALIVKMDERHRHGDSGRARTK